MQAVRRILAAVEQRVGDEQAGLQEVLGARLVLQPRRALFPPRHRPLEVRAPLPHRHARIARRIRPG